MKSKVQLVKVATPCVVCKSAVVTKVEILYKVIHTWYKNSASDISVARRRIDQASLFTCLSQVPSAVEELIRFIIPVNLFINRGL